MQVLSDEDRQAIEKALADAKMLRDELQKALRAGVDVSALQAQLNDAERRLRQIKSVYFPG